MEKARVRMIARMVLYVAVAAFAYAVLLTMQVWNGAPNAPRLTVQALIAATVGLSLLMPAGFALAMAKE